MIGASADPSKVGGSVLANLKAAGFPGRLVAVNATRPVVQGLPAVASILDVSEPIDLAVLAVPASAVLPTLKQCVTKGVPAAVVISAGFREAGDEGRAREAELRAWVREAPLRLIGPNCLGWIRPARRLNLTFAPGMPPAGPLGFFSHSGALATAILDWSREHHLGFSLLASLGNQADVDETDLLGALADDPETRVILGYLEGVADGRAFFAALAAAAARKPCVLMKAGRSAEGARAVSSHTGALAGSDRAFDAAVRQAGALRVTTLEELFDVARALVTGRTPPGRRVILVTNGGGLGILATDAARDAGLDVAPLPAAGAGTPDRRAPASRGHDEPGRPHRRRDALTLRRRAARAGRGIGLARRHARAAGGHGCGRRGPQLCWAPPATGRCRFSASSPAAPACSRASPPSRRVACRAIRSPSERCGRWLIP